MSGKLNLHYPLHPMLKKSFAFLKPYFEQIAITHTNLPPGYRTVASVSLPSWLPLFPRSYTFTCHSSGGATLSLAARRLVEPSPTFSSNHSV